MQGSVLADCSRRIHARRFDHAVGENVLHVDAAREQIVGNDLAMTLPPVGLRAHDRAALPGCGPAKRVERVTKWLGLRIVGIAAHKGVAPGGIVVAGVEARVAAASQVLEMPIGNAMRAQIAGEPLAIELRIAPRERNTPDVHQPMHGPSLQQSDEMLGRMAGMPDREEARAHAVPAGVGDGRIRPAAAPRPAV